MKDVVSLRPSGANLRCLTATPDPEVKIRTEEYSLLCELDALYV